MKKLKSSLEIKESEVQTETKKIKYPYVGIYISEVDQRTTIVLFTSRNTGIVLHSDHSNNFVGRHSYDWAEYGFTPFVGNVKIKAR